MSKRPPVDLLALTAEAAVPMTEAAQRAPSTAKVSKFVPVMSQPRAEPDPARTANTEPLNFKVSAEFRKRFRERALGADLKLNELLFAALAAWEREQGL
jgi:hypothetical protein